MDAVLALLFNHPIGLLSLLTILFVIAQGIYLSRYMIEPDKLNAEQEN